MKVCEFFQELAGEIVPKTARPKLSAQYNRRHDYRTVAATRRRDFMDSKYNQLIDNIAIRVSLNTAVFAVWLAVAVGLLQLAVKV
jgi:hypothetical protein